ncbi:MAG: signal recognition particle protein [Lachnospiraceae bacterium]|nr:signal recognition particle protein [Lachnospiraceae bacterium]
MAFESLSDKLQQTFKTLRGKGRLTEEDVRLAMKDVRMALLEADVNYSVVKDFTSRIREQAVGSDVMNGLNPAQSVIKLVKDELVELLGGEQAELLFQPGKSLTVIMMCGLQGSGKTTTAVKIAGKLREKGKKSLLAAGDVYRPAAIDQLKINAEKLGVDVFSMGTEVSPVDIAEKAVEEAKKGEYNVLIIDTAGRLQIDDRMMEELQEIKKRIVVHQTLLAIDAMTGQEAVNVASEFDKRIGVDALVITKLDSDTRGGAVLSVRAVTGKPVVYAGTGEKLDAIELFYPDRMADRILGMGDVLSLIEKAERNIDIDEDTGRSMVSRMKKGRLNYNDYLLSMQQMKGMGGLKSILGLMPGLGMKQLTEAADQVDDRELARTEAIILSMTEAERDNPKLMNPSRKRRIAAGAGLDIAEVNRFIKKFEQGQKFMKQMPGMLRGHGNNPFGF